MKNKGLPLMNIGLPHVEYGSTPWRIAVYPWRMWFYPCRIWVYLWKILWQLIKASAPKNSTIFHSTPKEILQLFELTPEEFHWSSSEGRKGTDTIFNAIVQKCSNLQGFVWNRHWVRVVFLIQILIFGGCCNRCFWDIRPRIHGLLNCNLFFTFLLTHPKTNFFRVYRRLVTWPKGL